jgi:hypothetical protein
MFSKEMRRYSRRAVSGGSFLVVQSVGILHSMGSTASTPSTRWKAGKTLVVSTVVQYAQSA